MARIKSVYGNESRESDKNIEYDRFSDEHMQELVRGVDASLSDDVFRMARAYPTFKIFFIEEDDGILEMDDDLYMYNSVKSISIHKSREDAADTAVVQLTNFRGNLDSKEFKAASHADAAVESVDNFSRKVRENFEKMALRPGTRIQIKLGYSSSHKDLNNTFTGKITEIVYGDMVTIVAQGYGVELLEPLGNDYWGKVKRSFWANPRMIAIDMIKTRPVKHLGRWKFGSRNRKASKPGWFRFDNPVDDNILLETGEWWALPNKWCTDFLIYHETAWDVIKDLERRFPGYIAQVVPFDKRATLFFGLPDSFYFFTGTKDPIDRNRYLDYLKKTQPKSDNQPDLNQKIFRDYHFKDSSHHIIANNIKMDLTDFYNRIIIKYPSNSRKYKDTKNGPRKMKVDKNYSLWADDSIDQEFWKTKFIFEENCENGDQAYLYALGNLLKHTRTLYSGELIVLGDPKIKPHDVVLFYDHYTKMHGPIGVREVTHTFDREEGFTTAIVPDLMIYINTPIHILTTIFGALKASTMAAISYFLSTSVANAVIQPIVGFAGTAFPVFLNRLGAQAKSRQPIGIIPLIYNKKPYIAGFEGMKYDSYITRTIDGFKKGLKEYNKGIEEVGAIISEVARRASR